VPDLPVSAVQVIRKAFRKRLPMASFSTKWHHRFVPIFAPGHLEVIEIAIEREEIVIAPGG
jgi:hypothetical protein